MHFRVEFDAEIDPRLINNSPRPFTTYIFLKNIEACTYLRLNNNIISCFDVTQTAGNVLFVL